MQDLEGFYHLIESELQNLPYDKCHKLIKYYVIDFLQKLPKDFDKTELPNEQIIYQKLLALTKFDIKQWHLEEITNCFYSLDDIAEDIEQKTRKEHKTAFLPAAFKQTCLYHPNLIL